jgi:hypothetical protein
MRLKASQGRPKMFAVKEMSQRFTECRRFTTSFAAQVMRGSIGVRQTWGNTAARG